MASVFSTSPAAPALSLRPRLTAAAQHELAALCELLATVVINPHSTDKRTIRGFANSAPTTSLYCLAYSHLPDDVFSVNIWNNAAPPRCKSFLWLVHHSKINTNARLNSRGADNDGSCPFCGLLEDVPHLFLGCPRAQCFWSFFGIASSTFSQVEQLWNADFPGLDFTSARMRSTIITGLLWSVWKCRNAKVFDHVDEPNAVTLRHCSSDLLLWRSRTTLPVDHLCLELWSSFFQCNP